ncbi:cyclic nucleotide-binding domain protein [Reticulomyxa filosa]|uniref:Cyclic nucleotide-binding domain protein n=1 Tax=Reticulomyxa filosa TaxID=46433 RepID=X6N1X0_RETFI|nr:cyclic nucleotide-binding domain protein [Reticulomyxa filosa]|eukprot:ETO20076.1 cyclic nucleotide-binding domain protein [Reticulomyxa filosa]
MDKPQSPTPSTSSTFWAPNIKNIKDWEKWDYIFSFASLLQFVGFASPDVVALRGFSAMSAATFMVAHAGRKFFVGWFWALSFCSVNTIMLIYLFSKKWGSMTLDEDEKELYDMYFAPYHMTQLEFKRLMKLSRKREVLPNETITAEGLPIDKLYFVTKGEYVVLKDETIIAHVNSQFDQSLDWIGETSFLSDTVQLATETVKSHDKVELIWWNRDELKQQLEIGDINKGMFYTVLTGATRTKLIKTDEDVVKLKKDSLRDLLLVHTITDPQQRLKIIEEYCITHEISSHEFEEIKNLLLKHFKTFEKKSNRLKIFFQFLKGQHKINLKGPRSNKWCNNLVMFMYKKIYSNVSLQSSWSFELIYTSCAVTLNFQGQKLNDEQMTTFFPRLTLSQS